MVDLGFFMLIEAAFMLGKISVSPVAIITFTGFLLLNGCLINGSRDFSSSVGVRICVQLFMFLLQYDACGGVFVPLLLQHDGVALLLALVVQALDLMRGAGVEVQLAGDVLQGVAVVGFDFYLWLLGIGGGEYAECEAEN